MAGTLELDGDNAIKTTVKTLNKTWSAMHRENTVENSNMLHHNHSSPQCFY